MAYKTVTTCITHPERTRDTLAAAAALAERHGAHLSVLCLGIDRTHPGAYYAGAQAIVLQSNMEAAQGEALEIEEAVAAQLAGATIPWDTQALTTQIGALAPVVGERAMLSDLVVLPKPYRDDAGLEDEAILEAALFQTRVPVLVLPEGLTDWTPRRRALIAWNSSPEALAAVRGALEFLAGAEEVDIAVIDPPRHSADRSDPGEALAAVLARHGAHASVSVLPRSTYRISDTIDRHAADFGADLVVMGAYGHSRLREAILGGATRNMLELATRPVLMAH